MPASTPIRLTLAQVKAAGLKAYEEGRLSAQGPTPEDSYRDKSGHPCIIGAALTDEQVALVEQADDYAIGGLISSGVVRCRARNSLVALQSAHDAWVFARRGESLETAAEAEAHLVKLLRAA